MQWPLTLEQSAIFGHPNPVQPELQILLCPAITNTTAPPPARPAHRFQAVTSVYLTPPASRLRQYRTWLLAAELIARRSLGGSQRSCQRGLGKGRATESQLPNH